MNITCSLKNGILNPTRMVPLPFDLIELEEYLDNKYQSEANIIKMILEIFVWRKQQYPRYETIHMGYNGFLSMIEYKYNLILKNEDISKALDVLITEEVIIKVVCGIRSIYSKRSNGYQLLRWGNSIRFRLTRVLKM